MVKSFFDPNWMDLGLLGVYGRWAGVNWVWSISLMIYHAAISIAIPILLVELIFPEQRDTPWLGRHSRIGLILLLTGDVIFGTLALTTYRPPFIAYALAMALTLSLVWLGRCMPTRFAWDVPLTTWKPFWLSVLGFAGIAAFFLCNWALPEWGFPPLLTCLTCVGGCYLILRLAWYASGGGNWDDRGRFSLATGVLSFFIVLAPLSEYDPARLDNTTGMMLVGLFAIIMLFFLRIRIQKRKPTSPPML